MIMPLTNDNLKPTFVWVFWYKQTCTI